MRFAEPRSVVLLIATVALAACHRDALVFNFDPIGDPSIPGTTFVGTATSVCPTPVAKSVLVDPTHDGGVWWFPQAHLPAEFKPDSAHQGKALADYLRGQGYTVRELGRGETLPVDSMMTYATIIRAAYWYNAAHPGYSTADLAAYAMFTSCQRTLVLLGEYLRVGLKDDLAESYGIPLTDWENGTITTWAAHPITSGATDLPFIAGSVVMDTSNTQLKVLGRLANGHAVAGVVNLPNAKLFWIGDMNGIQQVPQPLVANLVAWGFK